MHHTLCYPHPYIHTCIPYQAFPAKRRDKACGVSRGRITFHLIVYITHIIFTKYLSNISAFCYLSLAGTGLPLIVQKWPANRGDNGSIYTDAGYSPFHIRFFQTKSRLVKRGSASAKKALELSH